MTVCHELGNSMIHDHFVDFALKHYLMGEMDDILGRIENHHFLTI